MLNQTKAESNIGKLRFSLVYLELSSSKIQGKKSGLDIEKWITQFLFQLTNLESSRIVM